MPVALCDELVVGDPDPLAAEFEDVGGLGDFPGRGDLAEAVDEGGEFGGDVGSGVGVVRDEPVLRFEVERPGLALRPPAQLGVDPEVLAEQERGEEEGHLEPVLVRGAEEAERPVDVEDEAVAHRSFDAIEQAVELQLAEKLAIARGLLVADLRLDVDRAEQDRLRQARRCSGRPDAGRRASGRTRASGSRRGGRRTSRRRPVRA